MKILLLQGSPRLKGNSHALAEAFRRGAEKAGHQVSAIECGALQIGACKACGYCRDHGGLCLQQDDMEQIYSQWQSVDRIVFVSPVYYFNFSAQLKIVIDRFFAKGGTLKEQTTIKGAALLLTCGSGRAVAEPLIATYEAILNYLGWRNCGYVIADNVYAMGDIEEHAALTAAEQLGRELI